MKTLTAKQLMNKRRKSSRKLKTCLISFTGCILSEDKSMCTFCCLKGIKYDASFYLGYEIHFD